MEARRLKVVNISAEAHERAKTEAAAAGVGMGEWVSGRIMGYARFEFPLEFPEALTTIAQERSETPAETLEAALAALAAPRHAVPLKRVEPLHEDGMPYCGCDGESTPGPHHKGTCHRRRG